MRRPGPTDRTSSDAERPGMAPPSASSAETLISGRCGRSAHKQKPEGTFTRRGP